MSKPSSTCTPSVTSSNQIGTMCCRLGDLFKSRRERGRKGLPLLSVTMSDGLVDRDDIDRKQDTALTSEDHLLVKPGDIAYNMMRMWQGAFGFAQREGLVSPAYVVLAPKAGVNSKYISFLLRSPRMQYLLWAYSYGLTDDRLRLYFQDFARIPARIHDKSRQAAIASTLTVSEERLSRQRDMLENTIRLRSGALNRMLRPCSRRDRASWREFEFGDLVDRIRTTFSPSKEPAQSLCIELENIEPAIGQLVGQSATTPESSTKLRFKRGDVLFGKLRPYLRKYWVADRDGVCSSEFWVLRPSLSACTPEFLACLLQSEAFMRAVNASAGSKMPRAEWDYVVTTTIEVPSASHQAEICGVIRLIDQQISKQRDYIAALELEHRGLLQNLFSFELDGGQSA
jgi:type I restriction enzyme S subunit